MPPSGIRKAAMLLMALDPGTAAELLKAARPDLVPKIAAELMYLESTGQRTGPEPGHPLREFVGMLSHRTDGHKLDAFLREVLNAAVGENKAREILNEVRRVADERDPFIPIRTAPLEHLAAALQGEHPQAAALVLSELPPKKSAQLIPLLEEAVRAEAVRRMTCGEPISPEARARIASNVRKRLLTVRQSGQAEATARPEQRLRRVAILLRGVPRELRQNLIDKLSEQNADLSTSVQNMMVMWEDLVLISDRNFQDALRNVDAKQLALALKNADGTTAAKIRNNISERAAALVDEESSLMKSPKDEEVEAARETILGYLRQMNASGDLVFVGT